MKNYLINIITDSFMGHSTTVVVQGNNLQEAESKIVGILQYFGNNADTVDEQLKEIPDNDLAVLEKYGCVENVPTDEEEE